jgi:hypothetical protein
MRGNSRKIVLPCPPSVLDFFDVEPLIILSHDIPEGNQKFNDFLPSKSDLVQNQAEDIALSRLPQAPFSCSSAT